MGTLKAFWQWLIRILGIASKSELRKGLRKQNEMIERQLSILRRNILQSRRVLENVRHEESIPTKMVERPFVLDSYDETIADINRKYPDLIEAWRNVQNNGEIAYRSDELSSCSVDGHEGAFDFGLFISPYVHGRVLDIGCGPQPVQLLNSSLR
jgi:hypothetical protein